MFTVYILAAPVIALVLIILNWLISINNTYIEKDGPYECGFTSYQQSRTAISVAFILVAILFLPFDMEISLLLPYVISGYSNAVYGTSVLIILFIILTMAFIYEIKLNALQINRHWTPKLTDLTTKLYK